MKKVMNTRGETIAETLIALTIAALGLVMLASMINASSRMITTSREHVKQYVSEENRLAEMSLFKGKIVGEAEGGEPESGTATDDDSLGYVTIVEKKIDGDTTIKLTDNIDYNGVPDDCIPVMYFVNDEARGKTVELYNIISYKQGDGSVVVDETTGDGEG